MTSLSAKAGDTAAISRTPARAPVPEARRAPHQTPAQQLLAFCCAASAGVHIALVPSHWAESRLLAAGFVAAAVLLAGGAAIGAVAASRRWCAAAALLLAGLIALYLLSRTTGLPGVAAAEPFDVVGLATLAVEAIGLSAAVSSINGRTHA